MKWFCWVVTIFVFMTFTSIRSGATDQCGGQDSIVKFRDIELCGLCGAPRDSVSDKSASDCIQRLQKDATEKTVLTLQARWDLDPINRENLANFRNVNIQYFLQPRQSKSELRQIRSRRRLQTIYPGLDRSQFEESGETAKVLDYADRNLRLFLIKNDFNPEGLPTIVLSCRVVLPSTRTRTPVFHCSLEDPIPISAETQLSLRFLPANLRTNEEVMAALSYAYEFILSKLRSN